MSGFCQEYMKSYFNNGMDYFAVDLERQAFDFETTFANWLMDQHRGHEVGTHTYHTTSPYNLRTSRVPNSLIIPPQEYAMICIRNSTSHPVPYSYHWGDRAWQDMTVDAGGAQWHSFALEGGSEKSPDFQIRFDDDLSSPGREYTLARHTSTSQDCSGAKAYEFRVKEGVELYDTGN
jgi:hypothetical protein